MRRIWGRFGVGVLVAMLAMSAPAAQAAFAPVNPPPNSGGLSGIATSGSSWLAVSLDTTTGSFEPWLSTDGGGSWQQLDVGGQALQMHPSVGPDGNFYVAARVNGNNELFRFAPSGGAGQQVPFGLSQSGDFSVLAAPSWDAEGRMWVLMVDEDDSTNPTTYTLRLARVDGGSAVDEAQLNDPQGYAQPALDASGPVVEATDGMSTFADQSGSLVKLGDDLGLPQLRVGGLTFFSDGLSVDGGNTIVSQSAFSGGPISAVHGNSSLLVQNGIILRRWSGSLMVPSALAIPNNAGGSDDVWATRGGLLALAPGTAGGDVLMFNAGAAAALPANFGNPIASSRKMVGRANQVRAAAGLPPLTDNALIARAADNHSRYWTLNRPPSVNLLDYHSEQPGHPGFTGSDMSARCKAVGTECDSEILYPALAAVPAVNGWVPTLYHGAALLSPFNWEAGGAVHGRGPAVMDLGPSGGLVTAPNPFPSGRYLGNLFYTGEEPDPRAVCGRLGKSIVFFGPTIFLNPPDGGRLRSIELTGPGAGGRAYRGCTLPNLNAFLPDHPLQVHARYHVTAKWQLGSVPETTKWSFSTPKTGLSFARYP